MAEIDWNMKETEEYNKLAAMYDEYYAPDWPMNDNIQGLINFLNRWSGGNNILELGIGTGNVAGKLYLEGHHSITGVDLSPGMMEYAKHKCPKAKLLYEDLKKTNYQGYDWVIAVGSIFNRISHNDKPALFEKIYKEMSNGGFLFIGLRNFSYRDDFDPAEEIVHEFVNERRGFKIVDRFYWLTRDSYQGVTLYTRMSDNETIEYQYKTFPITGEDLIKIVTGAGFKHVGTGEPKDTGYYQNVWVFQK